MMSSAEVATAQTQAPTYIFQIPAENTAKALNDFAKQAGVQILFPYEVAAAHKAPAISGQFTRAEVLAKLLAGTGLEIADQSDTLVTLRVTGAKGAGGNAPKDELVVTGTHIRGQNPASPIRVIGRAEIEQSGVGEIGDLMRAIPENFSGGQNPGVINGAAANIGNNNITNASSVNLRGLGTDATLVLVNGHRLSADGYFQGADISGIPLSAVKRVEVVVDGASALYGSDAVAGVVNFIMRRDYSGGEATVRFGESSQGGGFQRLLSLQQGYAGARGYILGNVELTKQDDITAGDRTFTSNTPPLMTLLPSQTRKSLFLAGGYDLSDRIRLSADALLSERTSDLSLVFPPTVYNNHYVTPAHNIAASVDIDLFSDWSLHFTGVHSGSRNDSLTTMTSNPAYSVLYVYRNSTGYIEGTAEGTFASLPSGPVKLALGGGYREESFSQNAQGTGNTFKGARQISYGFVEAQIPLIAPSPDRFGLNALDLNLSARTENYSDFGSTSTPKIGILYTPFEALSLRATWGKSFKAPTFYQLYSATSVYLYQRTRVGGTGAGTAFFTRGGNPALEPETSKSRTFGADFEPKGTTLKISATAFAIDYTGRVVFTVPRFQTALSNPIYAPFIEPAPSLARQNELIAAADSFFNSSGAVYDPSNVTLVVHNNYANAAAQRIRGFDLSYRQSFTMGGSKVDPFFNATWLGLKQQTISTVPLSKLTGTIFNPPKFKARGGINWSAGAWSASGLVNYLSASVDTGIVPNADIGSWTTIDANVRFAFKSSVGFSRGLKVSVSATNLFDRSPPWTVSPTTVNEPHFDSTNASIVGRFVGVALTKAW